MIQRSKLGLKLFCVISALLMLGCGETKTPRPNVLLIVADDMNYDSPGFAGGVAPDIRDPEFVDKLKAIGLVERPDHPEQGSLSREKEMRAYFDGRYGYIYNNCYSDEIVKPGELGAIVPYGDPSFYAMKSASAQNIAVKERYDFYLQRKQEELYDWTTDPESKINLIDDPQYAEVLSKARSGLLQWMNSTDDSLIEEYEHLVGSVE